MTRRLATVLFTAMLASCLTTSAAGQNVSPCGPDPEVAYRSLELVLSLEDFESRDWREDVGLSSAMRDSIETIEQDSTTCNALRAVAEPRIQHAVSPVRYNFFRIANHWIVMADAGRAHLNRIMAFRRSATGFELIGRPLPTPMQTAVAGVVFDGETSEPLVGAEILFEESNLRAAADDDGRYFLGRLYAGGRFVTARHPGYHVSTRAVPLRIGLTSRADFPMWRVRTPETDARAPALSGRVTDGWTGAPLEGATVVAYPGARQATTDKVGRYRIDSYDPVQLVQVSLPCFATEEIEFEDRSRTRLDVVLEVDPSTAPRTRCVPPPDCALCVYEIQPGWNEFRRPAVFGRVTDAETGRPIDGVGIRVHKTGPEYRVERHEEAQAATRTDDEGYYVLPSVFGSIVMEFYSQCHLTVTLPFYHDGVVRRVDIAMPFYHPTRRGIDEEQRGCRRMAADTDRYLR